MNWWKFENGTQEQTQYTSWTIYKVYLIIVNLNKNMVRNWNLNRGPTAEEGWKQRNTKTLGVHREQSNWELCNRGEGGYRAGRQENDQRWVGTAVGCAYLQIAGGESWGRYLWECPVGWAQWRRISSLRGVTTHRRAVRWIWGQYGSP